MAATTDRRAEGIAKEFHAEYEALAPLHGYETREGSRCEWEAVPQNNRDLMIHVVQRLLQRGVIRADSDVL